MGKNRQSVSQFNSEIFETKSQSVSHQTDSETPHDFTRTLRWWRVNVHEIWYRVTTDGLISPHNSVKRCAHHLAPVCCKCSAHLLRLQPRSAHGDNHAVSKFVLGQRSCTLGDNIHKRRAIDTRCDVCKNKELEKKFELRYHRRSFSEHVRDLAWIQAMAHSLRKQHHHTAGSVA